MIGRNRKAAAARLSLRRRSRRRHVTNTEFAAAFAAACPAFAQLSQQRPNGPGRALQHSVNLYRRPLAQLSQQRPNGPGRNRLVIIASNIIAITVITTVTITIIAAQGSEKSCVLKQNLRFPWKILRFHLKSCVSMPNLAFPCQILSLTPSICVRVCDMGAVEKTG